MIKLCTDEVLHSGYGGMKAGRRPIHPPGIEAAVEDSPKLVGGEESNLGIKHVGGKDQ